MVKELFDQTYQHILNRYPLTLDVAADLRPRLAEPGPETEALKLEDYLRVELRDSPSSHRRARYWFVPLYLQELLLECGQQYTTLPDNYNRLVGALLDLERITIVTLNYDTIFDRVWENYYALHNERDYVDNPHFSLIKLHGSVNWGRRLSLADLDHDPAADGYRLICRELAMNPQRLSEDVEVLASPNERLPVDDLRSRSQYFYPAVSAPLGPNDKPTCPPSHRAALESTLSQQAYGYGLHVLVIGYSCLDKTPLEYIAKSENPIVSIVIVNGNHDAGEAALKQLQDYLESGAPVEQRDHVDVFNGGFSAFARPEHLRKLVERIKAA